MVWKRAVAFVCRSAYIFDCTKLPHSLNGEQTARLDAALRLAEEHIAHPHGMTELLDRKCLDLCVSLLDQRLTGNVYSSALVGFLAILGIDEANETYLDATKYTPKLPAFIKIAQLSAADPLDALDAIRSRFMTLNNPTPFTWALQLRAFGKQIRDSSTSMGYVRCFCDNPASTTRGWNLLQDPRNQKIFKGGNTLLLQRVLEQTALREEFGTLEVDGAFAWSRARFQKYKTSATEFLEILLLLVHITGGQSARGPEILGLVHVNTACHRNIFLEEGLIAIVTSYHKGYTCTGTTKIIHRYLPSEVSELLVIYLWLILPFIQKVGLLLRGKKCSPDALERHGPFLWPARDDAQWPSTRLSVFTKRETGDTFSTPITVAMYRHIAIALSRRHLEEDGFRRDYGTEENASDRHTAHTIWTAGRLYARGLEQAPGHVESRRSEFRATSRRWHSFLGFAVPSVKCRLPFQDVTNLQRPNPHFLSV
ncbi:hypothetical protein LTR95_000960 [Oleoguttula sp. CCFEE 5521]